MPTGAGDYTRQYWEYVMPDVTTTTYPETYTTQEFYIPYEYKAPSFEDWAEQLYRKLYKIIKENRLIDISEEEFVQLMEEK